MVDIVFVLNPYAVIFLLEQKKRISLHSLFHTTKNYTEFILTFLSDHDSKRAKKTTMALSASLLKFINATSVIHRDIWICTQALTDRMTCALFFMQSVQKTMFLEGLDRVVVWKKVSEIFFSCSTKNNLFQVWCDMKMHK